jgi:hypothetical protein
MNIEILVQSILDEQEEIDASILEIFKTGSQLFTERETDVDFVVVCSGYQQRRGRVFRKIDGVKYDIIIYDQAAILKSLDFSSEFYFWREKSEKLYNYTRDSAIRQTVYGSPSFQWSMMEHKEEYLSYIAKRFNKNKNIDGSNPFYSMVDHWKMGKHFVHYYTILKIYENGKVEITPEIIKEVELMYSQSPEAQPSIEWVLAKIKEIE